MLAPDLTPKYRHVLVDGTGERIASKVLLETPNAFMTPAGMFDKSTKRKFGDPTVSYYGPFTAEGDMENRP
ncbi:hypothetical protein EN780_03240 [Mesorhizobium sp. M4B.F.Ca.ET.089.01.1.1]|uniref:hypothetical protein n=1 Tax=Mesorhizobium sp. M4B.F.Ca.ET.089.01.1.1 TaxID=2496662 RepID=UPI000FE3FB5F|nr:hypothetical protein [Mesorhizobium sp. M4B.F.Ca.ET.089.01.1.1]RWX70422.1 hypothetical protein EN780_03240 [Mesorhizobium sp. M4B.F.Ca.ET.089.01.1.1]TIX40811.1 MAG: hypothetical protein E5V40_12330 [Mesorhizobium sp.]